MRMLLRPEYLNGPFGDPALYVWETNEKDAILVDCGDLSQFTPKQLLKVRYIFLSHCHMDHFFGFDTFLRIHMGVEKTVFLYGPPETSDRVAGKLQGYTWNLIDDHNLEFVVMDLNPQNQQKITTRFHAKNRFKRSEPIQESWNPNQPILNTPVFQVHTALLDHRTPSLAYSIEEKVTVKLNSEAIIENGFQPGIWIGELKDLFLFNRLEKMRVPVPLQSGGQKIFDARQLADLVLVPRQRHKIAYATDGAASDENRKKLLELIGKADVFFSETCFLQEDVKLANDTKHFTAAFMGSLATEAQVKSIAPFHFSKRYLKSSERVYQEVESHFRGNIEKLRS